MPSLLQTARSALRLDARARTQAARALGWLAVTRAALVLVPYSAVRRAVARVGPRRPQRGSMTVAECGRAIDRATRVLPGARCLARGVAAECLLRREGRPATLTVGVRFDEHRRFHSHAWVESDGVIVTGGDEAARYASLGPRRAP